MREQVDDLQRRGEVCQAAIRFAVAVCGQSAPPSSLPRGTSFCVVNEFHGAAIIWKADSRPAGQLILRL